MGSCKRNATNENIRTVGNSMVERKANIWLHVFIASILFMGGMLALNRCETDPLVDNVGRLHGGVAR